MADYHKFPDAPEGTPESNFVHLHVHTDYSLLDGASKIDTLVARAKELNMKALAITDHGNMFGVLNFEKLCHLNGINPIVGQEFYVAEGSRFEQNPSPYTESDESGKIESYNAVEDDETLQAVFEIFKEENKEEFNFID